MESLALFCNFVSNVHGCHVSLESCEFEKSLYLHIHFLMEIRDLFIYVLLARLSSHTSHLRIHLPFQAQGQHDVRLESFLVVPFPASCNDVFIQGPLQILDILTIFLKGCLLVHPSLSPSRVKMLLVRRKLASESISNTGKTCFSCSVPPVLFLKS